MQLQLLIFTALLQACQGSEKRERFLHMTRRNGTEAVKVTCDNAFPKAKVWAFEMVWKNRNRSYHLLQRSGGQNIVVLFDGYPHKVDSFPFEHGSFVLKKSDSDRAEFFMRRKEVFFGANVTCKVFLFNGTSEERTEIFQPPLAQNCSLEKAEENAFFVKISDDVLSSRRSLTAKKASHLVPAGMRLQARCHITRGAPEIPKEAFSIVFNDKKQNATWENGTLRWIFAVPFNRKDRLLRIQCRVHDRVLHEWRRKSFYQRPRLVILPNNANIAETAPFQISCFAIAVPAAKVRVRLLHPNATYESAEGFNVTLTAPSILNGDYLVSCESENVAGRMETSKMFKSSYKAPNITLSPSTRLLPPDGDVTVTCSASGLPPPLTRLVVLRGPERQSQRPVATVGLGSSVLRLRRGLPVGRYDMCCAANNTQTEVLMFATYVVRTLANVSLVSGQRNGWHEARCAMSLSLAASEVPEQRFHFAGTALSVTRQPRGVATEHEVVVRFEGRPGKLERNASCESDPTEDHVIGDKKEATVQDQLVPPKVTDLLLLCPSCRNYQPSGENITVVCRVRFGSESFPNVTLRIGDGAHRSLTGPFPNCGPSPMLPPSSCVETDVFGRRWANFSWEVRIAPKYHNNVLSCRAVSGKSSDEKNRTLNVTYALLSFNRKPNSRIFEGESVVCRSQANPPDVLLRTELEGGVGKGEEFNPELALRGPKIVAIQVKLQSNASEQQTVICRTLDGAKGQEVVEKISLTVEPSAIDFSIRPKSGSAMVFSRFERMRMTSNYSSERIELHSDACLVSPRIVVNASGIIRFSVLAYNKQELRCDVAIKLKVKNAFYERSVFYSVEEIALAKLETSKINTTSSASAKFRVKCVNPGHDLTNAMFNLSLSSKFIKKISILQKKTNGTYEAQIFGNARNGSSLNHSSPVSIGGGVTLISASFRLVELAIPFKPIYDNLCVSCAFGSPIFPESIFFDTKLLSVTFGANLQEPKLLLLPPTTLHKKDPSCTTDKSVTEVPEDRMTLLQCPMLLGNPPKIPFAKINGEDLGPPMIGHVQLDEMGHPWRNFSWYFRPSLNPSDKFIECGLKSAISIKRGFNVTPSTVSLSLSHVPSSNGSAISAKCSSARGEPQLSLFASRKDAFLFNVTWRRQAPLEIVTRALHAIQAVNVTAGGLGIRFALDARLAGASVTCVARGLGSLSHVRRREIPGR